MSLVFEMPLFEIILQILDLENEKLNIQKNIFQAPLNDAQNNFFSKIQKLELNTF